MKGKISKIKDTKGELALPITTVEAVYMGDGTTKLSDGIKDVLRCEVFDDEGITVEISSVVEEIDGIKKDISEINSSLDNIEDGKATKQEVDVERKRIDDINSSLDTKANKREVDNNINELDVKIAENKSLTDSEISRLKEIANTWEAFKNSGGEINGGIQAHALKNIYTLTSGEKERCYYFGSLNNFDTTIGMEILDKKSGFDTKVELVQGGNPTLGGQGYFGSSHDLITNLGSDNKRWKDVWVGSYSKNANGYTKLPNGLIMQWGHLHLANNLGSGVIRVTVPFPIQFPTDVLRVYLTPNVNQYSVDDEYTASWERPPVTCQITSSNFEFAFKRLHEHFGAGIDWFAIGY